MKNVLEMKNDDKENQNPSKVTKKIFPITYSKRKKYNQKMLIILNTLKLRSKIHGCVVIQYYLSKLLEKVLKLRNIFTIYQHLVQI